LPVARPRSMANAASDGAVVCAVVPENGLWRRLAGIEPIDTSREVGPSLIPESDASVGAKPERRSALEM
jgi:hypothetical protein